MEKSFKNYSAKWHKKRIWTFSGEQMCPSVTNTLFLSNLTTHLVFPGCRFSFRNQNSPSLMSKADLQCWSSTIARLGFSFQSYIRTVNYTAV